MFMKPSLAAPGGSVVSTFPLVFSGWAVEFGTAMAAPYVAGVAALLLQSREDLRSAPPAERSIRVHDLLESTASYVHPLPINATSSGGELQTVAQQGAGLIDAYAALRTTSIVHPGEFLLNDTVHFVKS